MIDIPTVALNDETITNHPLTTEDPVINNPELLQGLKDINKVDPIDKQVPAAIIIDKDDPNKIDIHREDSFTAVEEFQNVKHDTIAEVDEDSDDDYGEEQQIIIDESPCKSPPKIITFNHAPAATVTTTTTVKGALDISPIVNPTSIQREVEEESDTDDELIRITEANRFIPANTQPTQQQRPRSKSLRSQSVSTRRQLLVFADTPTVTKKSDRIIVSNRYGAGPEGSLSNDLKPTRKCRSYLVACDFSDESFHAIEWTMGTMMRDGDKLYVVTAVNRDDNPEAVKEAGLSLAKEVCFVLFLFF